MFDIVTLQKQLVEKALPSGFEQGVGAYLGELAKPFVDEVYTDALGNVICHKKGEGKKIMLTAHMDLIGFMVTYIDEKGYIRFEPIGGHNPVFIHRTPVMCKKADGTVVRGVLMGEKWAKTSQKHVSEVRPVDLYIDCGMNSREVAEQSISIGDVFVFDNETIQQGDKVLTPYADDLVACIVLLKTMEQLQKSPYDVYFVFTVQEEVGLRGFRPNFL